MSIRNLAVIAVVTSAACAPSLSDEPQVSSSHRAISATKWLSCWVRPGTEPDPDFRMHTIECSAGIAATGPMPLERAIVELRSKQGTMNHVGSKRLETGDPFAIGRARPADFPLELNVMLAFGAGTVGPDIPRTLEATTELTADRTIERPIVLEQPFDIWPVTFEVNADALYGGFSPYDVSLAPFTAENRSITKLSIQKRISPRPRGKVFDMFFVVPRGARPKITGLLTTTREKVTSDKQIIKLELDGPGTFRADPDRITRTSGSDGMSTQSLEGCPTSWSGDGVCDACLGNDPDCRVNGIPGCEAQWQHDGICDPCLGNDMDCGASACPATWRGDGVCDACLGNDPDCAADCPDYFRNDGICDTCLGDDPDCKTNNCPASWRGDGVCDACLGDDPDCSHASTCPESWRGDGVCDTCLGNDPDCTAPESCPVQWYGDGVCDECLGDDPDCEDACPIEWYDDGICDECLGDDPDCD